MNIATDIDKNEQLSLKDVDAYVSSKISIGRAEYNGRTILVKSTDPLIVCGENGTLEDYHVATGQQFRFIREVAHISTSGRRAEEMQYGMGIGGICHMTLVNRIRKAMCGADWARISTLCFAGKDLDGRYNFTETDYSELLKLAPAYQKSFDELDKTITEQMEIMKNMLATPEPA